MSKPPKLTMLRPKLTTANLQRVASPATNWGGGLGGRPWRRVRAAILVRDHYVCQVCGVIAEEVDHIVPRSQGGSDDPSNLRAICVPCHEKKSREEANLGSRGGA